MKLKIKSMGEGGVHIHGLETPKRTFVDGMHKHLFLINGRLLLTDLSGEHAHGIDLENNETNPELEPKHDHLLMINTTDGVQTFRTSEGSPHFHEIQTSGTTVSGLHVHLVEIGDEGWISLLPSDVLEEIANQAKNFKSFKLFKRVK